ncbi:MAG: glutamyl-tRNA reductase [Myxococcales bacterium]
MSKDLVVLGLSHHGTPVSIRERLASGDARLEEDLRELMQGAGLEEGVLLNTCNRVELIGTTRELQRSKGFAVEYFNQRAAPERVDPYLYEHHGLDAVRHVFRVASGLDSMVLGEPQILGQVKDAYSRASSAGTVGTMLGRCFDRTFGVAKRVRTETEIAAGNVSVSSIACDLAGKIFGDLAGRNVLLIGAGKMSETAARSLAARGASLTVVNRNPERARALAEACGGEPRPLESLATELAHADVVISSTAKEGFIITHELMQGVVKMRKFRQLFIIDIAVPRDVDPRVDTLRNVFVYDMDDLKRVSHANLAARERATGEALAIIEQEVDNYGKWLRSLEITPTIVALRARVRELILREKDKARGRLGELAPKQEKALDAMCESIVNQLLHKPLTELKRGQLGEDGPPLTSAVQRLFGLELDDGEDNAAAKNARAAREGEGALAPAGGRKQGS